MYADSIHETLSNRLHAASPIQGRHVCSVTVKIDQDDPQSAWVTITDHADTGELVDHLFRFSWTDVLVVNNLTDSVVRGYLFSVIGGEHVARELEPHLGMDYTGKIGESR